MAWEHKSMLRKSRERSAAKKYLNRNLAAGHRTPNEHYLERAGLRGRKKWLCCGFIFLLFLFAMCHLAVMQLLKPDHSSFADIFQVALEVASQLEAQPLLSLDQREVNVNIGESLSIRNRAGSRQLLNADSSLLQVDTLSLMGGLKTTSLTTNTLGGVNRIESMQRLTLMGLGGVTARGGVVNVTAQGDTTLTGQTVTINGDTVLRSLPRPSPAESYHLCVHSNGTLFLVPHNPRRCLGPT